MRNSLLALLMFVTTQAIAQSAPRTGYLQEGAPGEIVASAEQFATFLRNTVWTIHCEEGEVPANPNKIGFETSGGISLNEHWAKNRWIVQAPRNVRIIEPSGHIITLQFSPDAKAYKFVDWQLKVCRGSRIA